MKIFHELPTAPIRLALMVVGYFLAGAVFLVMGYIKRILAFTRKIAHGRG